LVLVLAATGAGAFVLWRDVRRSCAKGAGRSTVWSTTLNTAVLAPMPSASVRTVSVVNPAG
jgi:hypothetical protein